MARQKKTGSNDAFIAEANAYFSERIYTREKRWTKVIEQKGDYVQK